MKNIFRLSFFIFLVTGTAFIICNCKTAAAASAQEYFSIGMAYFDLGRYDEAEKWLNRARQMDRIMTASEYNLGRIAFETQKYNDAVKYFENILKRDPDNVLALRAAAYTRIKMGDISIAEQHYGKLLTLVPESTDDGYNHALVLYAMERYGEAEQVLESYPFTLQDNTDEMLLLYARTRKALDKVEAIDTYSKWLESNQDAKVRYEYAQILEQHELYARALEEYRIVLSSTEAENDDPKRSDLHFALARLLLVADAESAEGITELETAVAQGFNDIEAVEALQKNELVSAANRNSLRNIVNTMQRTLEAAAATAAAKENEE
jgi:tetratricopeptide (TPR) repeat protein